MVTTMKKEKEKKTAAKVFQLSEKHSWGSVEARKMSRWACRARLQTCACISMNVDDCQAGTEQLTFTHTSALTPGTGGSSLWSAVTAGTGGSLLPPMLQLPTPHTAPVLCPSPGGDQGIPSWMEQLDGQFSPQFYTRLMASPALFFAISLPSFQCHSMDDAESWRWHVWFDEITHFLWDSAC